jgi:hypothetical protein
MAVRYRKAVLMLFLSVIVFSGLAGSSTFAWEDESGLMEYPGGDYGIDMGGGYEVTPDGRILPPQGYRDDYRDTKYGPMTQTGFVVFPGFEFADVKAGGEVEKKKQEEETKELIFYEYTTSPAGNSIWGVSSPRK